MMSFLKPNLWKIILAGILFYGSSALWRAYVIRRISDTFPHGFPFQFYLAWGPCPPEQSCSEFNWLYLLLDLIIWYIVGAFFVDQIRKSRML